MKKADMIKNKIIHLTKDIMFEQGYDLVSIREIAKKASMNIAAVNYYFLNKNNLMAEVLVVILKDLLECLRTKVGEETSLFTIDELALLLFDGLLENRNLYDNCKRMIFDRGVMNSSAVKKQKDRTLFSPGYSLLYDYLGQTVTFSDSNARQRISWHLQGIIDQSLFLLRNSGEGKHLPVRESLRKTAQEFGERLDFKKSLKEEKQMALIQ